MSLIEAEIVAPARTYRDYSPEFKTLAIATVEAHDGNVARAARELEMSEDTLRVWMRDAERYRDFNGETRLALASKYEFNLHRLVDSIADDDLSKATLAGKATAIGILTDKMLLLRGQATSISQSNLTDDERNLRLAELAAKLQGRVSASNTDHNE